MHLVPKVCCKVPLVPSTVGPTKYAVIAPLYMGYSFINLSI